MQPRVLEVGDVVQIDPEEDEVFGACFMVVTSPRSWGAEGYVQALPGFNEDGSRHLGGRAYKRCEFEKMHYIGKDEWVWEVNLTPD